MAVPQGEKSIKYENGVLGPRSYLSPGDISFFGHQLWLPMDTEFVTLSVRSSLEKGRWFETIPKLWWVLPVGSFHLESGSEYWCHVCWWKMTSSRSLSTMPSRGCWKTRRKIKPHQHKQKSQRGGHTKQKLDDDRLYLLRNVHLQSEHWKGFDRVVLLYDSAILGVWGVGRANNVHHTYYVLDMTLLTFFLSFLINLHPATVLPWGFLT